MGRKPRKKKTVDVANKPATHLVQNPISSELLLNNDLVLGRILFFLDLESLKTCRLVCRRWEGQVSATLRKHTPHTQMVIRFDHRVNHARYLAVNRFFGGNEISYTLALSLRPDPWTRKFCFTLHGRGRNYRQQNLTPPFFSSSNKELRTSEAFQSTPFSYVRELHLEMLLRSRHDHSLLWTLLGQFPCLVYLRLTFPIILSHVLPFRGPRHGEPTPLDPGDMITSVKNLSLLNTQAEKDGICLNSWRQFLRRFPNLVALTLHPFIYSPEFDAVSDLVGVVVDDLETYPHFSALNWTISSDTAEHWGDVNRLNLRYLRIHLADSVDALWSGLGQESKNELRACHLICAPTADATCCCRKEPVIGRTDIWSHRFPNLSNLCLCWFLSPCFSQGWMKGSTFIRDLATLFEEDNFSASFPVLTSFSFLPLELNTERVQEVWDTMFNNPAARFPNIKRLALSLGYRAGCEDKRLTNTTHLFPNLLELRHFKTKKGSCSIAQEEELWTCAHRYTLRSNIQSDGRLCHAFKGGS